MVVNKKETQRPESDSSSGQFHVIYLGENGFPVGFGAIQKMIMVSKALIHEGAKVTVVNRKGKFDPAEPREMPLQGRFEGIDYVYTSGSIYRPKGLIARNLIKLKGYLNELLFIKKLKQKNQLDAAIISCHEFMPTLIYRLYGYLFDFPVVYNHVELTSAIEHRRGLANKINDYFFERVLIPSMDAAFPISEVLINQFQEVAPSKPQFKIPILCEFEKFDIEVPQPERDFFLYCGALDYRELIDFVLEAYDQLPRSTNVDLHFVLGGGTESDFENLIQHIRAFDKHNQIKVFHNVNHADIPGHYKPAKALLIPLRPTVQDAARFPHKIGEYVASGNPMISTNYGEVRHYFKDGETALIADEYTTEAFAKKMQYVVAYPEEAKKIGQAGKQLGLKAFNHLTYGAKILTFLKEVKTRKTS